MIKLLKKYFSSFSWYAECKVQSKSEESINQKQFEEAAAAERPHGSNSKLFPCSNCKKELYLSSIEILKHKKMCR